MWIAFQIVMRVTFPDWTLVSTCLSPVGMRSPNFSSPKWNTQGSCLKWWCIFPSRCRVCWTHVHSPCTLPIFSVFKNQTHVLWISFLACQQNAVVQPVHTYPTWCKSFLFLHVFSFVICSFAFSYSSVFCHSLLSPDPGACSEYNFLFLTYTKKKK